jgi:phospholipase/carboxylesterase
MEGESRRFFKRLAEGVFDLEDLEVRTRELGDFVRAAAVAYELERHRIVAVGYSNGANIASSLMFREPDALAGAVLLRPMVPFTPDPVELLSGIPVLICAGERDPLRRPGDTEHLAEIFKSADADVTLHVAAAGHELVMNDVVTARDWIGRNFAPAE